MGKLVAPFMLNMGVDIICNEILKISQQTFITDPMRRCNIYMYIVREMNYIHIFKRPRFIMKLKSIVRVTLLRGQYGK